MMTVSGYNDDDDLLTSETWVAWWMIQGGLFIYLSIYLSIYLLTSGTWVAWWMIQEGLLGPH